jgi:hypothetical protein
MLLFDFSHKNKIIIFCSSDRRQFNIFVLKITAMRVREKKVAYKRLFKKLLVNSQWRPGSGSASKQNAGSGSAISQCEDPKTLLGLELRALLQINVSSTMI